MILAAGYGTRLWPLTLQRAKPAVPFLTQPLISYAVAYLRRFAIDEMIVNLHHHPESVRAAVLAQAPTDIKVHFSVEPQVLGTGGALDKVRALLSDETFVVINGKIITEINLAAAMETHREKRALATLVLRPNPDGEHFSRVEVDSSGRITKFAGIPQPLEADPAGAPDPPLMFTGIQILEPRIFQYIPRGKFSHTTTEAYPRAIECGEIVAAHISAEPWYELSTLERYLDTHLLFLHRQGQSFVLGKDSIMETGAEIAESVIWDGVRVLPGASLHQCIVGDRVTIPANSRFERVAIVPGELCPHPDHGEFIGDNLIVPF
jgi:NDP-sugar pyrophosphorylase family protein